MKGIFNLYKDIYLTCPRFILLLAAVFNKKRITQTRNILRPTLKLTIISSDEKHLIHMTIKWPLKHNINDNFARHNVTYKR